MVKKKSKTANKSKKKIKAIEEKILKVAIDLAKKGEGALFVIGDRINYESLLRQKFEQFSVFDPGADKLLKSLATIDGAIIINKEGTVISYGAMIRKAKPFLGYGTRHAAAITASKNKNISILCSEEEQKVKIFRDGRFIMQIDALQKNVERDISKITTFLESIGAGFVGTVGVATLAPALGITLIPGVLIFGGSYFAIKAIMARVKKIKK